MQDELDPLERARLGIGIEQAQESDLPNTIKTWLSGLNSTDSFKITPQKSRETDGAIESFPSIEGRIPEMLELGTKYGSGRYRFLMEYRPKNWTVDRKGFKNAEPSEWFVLSESGFDQLHKDYVEQQRKNRLNVLRQESEEKQAIFGKDNFAGMERMIGLLAPFVAPLLGRLLAPPPPPPDNTALLIAVLNGSAESARAQSMASQKMFEQMQSQSNESTRTLVSILTSKTSDSAEKSNERIFAMIDKMLDVKTRVEQMNGNENVTQHEEKESGFDWSAILTTLGTVLIPKLGMLATLPMKYQQQMVQAEMQKTPESVQMLDYMKSNENARVQAIQNFVAHWGMENAKQVLDIGGFQYTQSELEQAETLVKPQIETTQEVAPNA